MKFAFAAVADVKEIKGLFKLALFFGRLKCCMNILNHKLTVWAWGIDNTVIKSIAIKIGPVLRGERVELCIHKSSSDQHLIDVVGNGGCSVP